MAIAELLGVEFDMQLLLKMSLSVATVLLVSLVYRFYSSRSTEEIQVNHCQEPQTCKRCKTQLTDGTNDDLLGPSSSEDDKQNTTEDNPVQDASNLSNCDQHFSKEANVPSTSGRELNPPNPAKSGLSSTKGRRSTSFLKKVEGGMGVGRELRQELEQRGVYSSFISKSEIKVEDAKLVLDHPSDQVVYGKIYEYYVESSSHCSTNPNNIVGQNETNSEPRQTETGSHSSILMESPSSVDFDITEESSLLGNPMSTSTPLRKHSYLAAAEQSALPSPVSTSCSSTSAGPLISSSINNKHQNGSKCPDLEAVLLNRFVHRSDVENLKSQVDLGNCLEALFLAKKYGERSVVQAAVEVMSDNYLQVLLDRDLYGRLTGAERELIRRQRTSGRRFIVVADMNPQDSSSDSRAVKKKPSALYYYDDFQDTWDKLCSIPPEVISNACGMCTMDNYLFVAVGMDSEATPSKRVFCYNPLTDIWKEISSMNEARPRCKLAALDGYIYAIGGECLTSVERYDPHSDKWTFVAPLPNDTFAVAHHVTVCNRELFVSGGTIRYMLLRYSPKNDTWRGSLLAGNKDRTADLVAVGPFLYRFEVNPLLGISVYRYHTVARLWYQCDTKRLPNCAAFQCVAMDDNIYCVSRHFTLRFEADEISPAFAKEHLSISVTNGLLFPFVLSLPDKKPLQTSV